MGFFRIFYRSWYSSPICVIFVIILMLYIIRIPVQENVVNKPWCTLNISRENESVETIEHVLSQEMFVLNQTGYRSQTGDFIMHHHFKPSSLIISDALVTLCTFSTVHRMHEVLWLTRAWSGPVSVAVFTPSDDFNTFLAISGIIRKCFPDSSSRISYHILYPSQKRPVVDSNLPRDLIRNFTCNSLQQLHSELDSLISNKFNGKVTEYSELPQNHLRNLARQTSQTPFSLPIDIDMIPTPTMFERLNLLLMNSKFQCSKCLLIIPTYEIYEGQSMLPATKMTLLKMILHRNAQRYHAKVNLPNQANSGLRFWEGKSNGAPQKVYWNLEGLSSNNLILSNERSVPYDLLYSVTSYEEFWEPIVVMRTSTPYFDERFMGYGFTRSSLIYELHAKGYKFYVLDDAFLCHWGFQTTTSYPDYRKAEIKKNLARYEAFKREMKARYSVPSRTLRTIAHFKKVHLTKNKVL